jgi:hypothetical protein
MRGMNFIGVAYLKLSSIEGDFDRIKYQRNKTEKFFSLKVFEHLKKNTHKLYKKEQGVRFHFPFSLVMKFLNLDIASELGAETELDTGKDLKLAFEFLFGIFHFFQNTCDLDKDRVLSGMVSNLVPNQGEAFLIAKKYYLRVPLLKRLQKGSIESL